MSILLSLLLVMSLYFYLAVPFCVLLSVSLHLHLSIFSLSPYVLHFLSLTLCIFHPLSLSLYIFPRLSTLPLYFYSYVSLSLPITPSFSLYFSLHAPLSYRTFLPTYRSIFLLIYLSISISLFFSLSRSLVPSRSPRVFQVNASMHSDARRRHFRV